jgi:hypothetical protein
MIIKSLAIKYLFAYCLLSVLVSSCLLSSCKNEFKETAPVQVSLKLTNPINSNSISISGGTARIGSFGISGDRKQGDGVSFLNNLSNETTADLSSGTINPIINFDLFQGTYTRLDINLGMNPTAENGSIELLGLYNEGLEEGENKNFVFRYEPEMMLNWNLAISEEINIVADQNTEVLIELDANYLFSGIPESLWHHSSYENINGEEIIYITSQKNTAIYTILIGRLNAAFSAHLK